MFGPRGQVSEPARGLKNRLEGSTLVSDFMPSAVETPFVSRQQRWTTTPGGRAGLQFIQIPPDAAVRWD